MSGALADDFVAAIERGSSLRQAGEEVGMSPQSFLRRCDADAGLSERYARARAIADEAGFLSLDEISDEPPPLDQYGKVDPGWVSWQKLRLETRRWTLARKHPTKYGDKVQQEISGPGGGAIKTEALIDVSGLTPDQLRALAGIKLPRE